MTDPVCRHFLREFRKSLESRASSGCRIGTELKFPLVDMNGRAAKLDMVYKLWEFLRECGWRAIEDGVTRKVVGARKRGDENDTVASCETGFCKVEFSLAHVGNLFELEESISRLCRLLVPFCEKEKVLFLGYGIQPITPPSKHLLMIDSRSGVWDKVFGSRRLLPQGHGEDVNIFTINAASHVHLGLSYDDTIPAVNVLNGFSGGQIALTANSSIWKARIDSQYKCVSEKFWDWWMPNSERVGIPVRPFADLSDYVHTISQFKPVYVRRNGKPVLLPEYDTFKEYYESLRPAGVDPEGRKVTLAPEEQDINLHSSCYWYNARISRYYTVENRVNDQQPPGDLICVAALTLGLVSALGEAQEELRSYDWQALRRARDAACQDALAGRVDNLRLEDLSRRMLGIARLGLTRRGLGEERFLVSLENRLRQHECPADEAIRLYKTDGIRSLLNARRL